MPENWSLEAEAVSGFVVSGAGLGRGEALEVAGFTVLLAAGFAGAERERFAAVEAVLPVEVGAADLVTVQFSKARKRHMPFATLYVGI